MNCLTMVISYCDKKNLADPLNMTKICVNVLVCNLCDPSREKGPCGNCEKYRPWADCAVRAG